MMPVSWKRWTLSLVAVGAVAASVSGCVPLVLGGAAVGGTVVAIDRRSTGIQVEDEAIEMRVANAIREKVGTEARKELEAFLGTKVFLEIFVKVSDKWRDNERDLKNFGYIQD